MGEGPFIPLPFSAFYVQGHVVVVVMWVNRLGQWSHRSPVALMARSKARPLPFPNSRWRAQTGEVAAARTLPLVKTGAPSIPQWLAQGPLTADFEGSLFLQHIGLDKPFPLWSI